MERVQSKQRGSQCGGPDSRRSFCSAAVLWRFGFGRLSFKVAQNRPRPGHFKQPAQQKKQEYRISRMQQQVHRMMPGRTWTEELNIEHVREPGERVPIRSVNVGKCPARVFQ